MLSLARSETAPFPAPAPAAGLPALARAADVPDYLRDVYFWAYLNPRNVELLDRQIVVDTLLFLNARRLMRAALAAIPPAQGTLMAAHVYGDFPVMLADHVGRGGGRLDLVDVAPIQVEHARRKLGNRPWVSIRQADAEAPGDGQYDSVLSFMLLHELPSDKKQRVINSLLARVRKGGRAVFVDYHNPSRLTPFRYLLSVVNDCLEPFAKELWRRDIRSYSSCPSDFAWTKDTYFAGVYQRVVATRV